ncbi:DNA cytosine methyltransferase [Avibacterium avium]|uniref:DNA cytosine methyltransferase n=1 Tax=Avibacterium avium TaxID=751 RepID=UPI003BF8FA78
MNYLSLFSGIEAATVAWKQLGWRCVGFSEIEPFPCAVLAHHYPGIPNLGDVTKITEQKIKDLGRIDLIVFGSPCQNLSVAGNRQGLEGKESQLFFEAIRIINYAKKHNGLRFALWENVPGAFSSNKGADFAAVVREMAGIRDINTPQNGWGNSGIALGENGLLEWRMLDAQYFGLAQRRKRVFAILDTGDWASRKPILLEQESVRGNTTPSREKERETTRTIKRSIIPSRQITQALTTSQQRLSTNDTYIICHGSQTTISGINKADCVGRNNGLENIVAYNVVADTTPKIGVNIALTMRANGGGGIVPSSVAYRSKVRRLTPIECERLQGFPDNYTRIPYRNKPLEQCPNGPRYKALGNSMAVPVMNWIGKKISMSGDV